VLITERQDAKTATRVEVPAGPFISVDKVRCSEMAN
jgi:hypothetical protein